MLSAIFFVTCVAGVDDEDFNRTWGRLDRPATTLETRRAQVVKPYVERADLLLDLHSMHDDCVPLMLCANPCVTGRMCGAI